MQIQNSPIYSNNLLDELKANEENDLENSFTNRNSKYLDKSNS